MAGEESSHQGGGCSPEEEGAAAGGSAVDDSDAPVVPGDEGGADGVRCDAVKARVVSVSAIASWCGGGAWPERTARWCCARVEDELHVHVVLGVG